MNQHLTEGDFAPQDLTPYWYDAIAMHRGIFPGGDRVRAIRSLMEYIIAQGYSSYIYPYASVAGLLMSLPKRGLINYERSIRISYDNLLQYGTAEEHMIVRAIGPGTRDVICKPSEIIDTFEHFLDGDSDWSRAARSK